MAVTVTSRAPGQPPASARAIDLVLATALLLLALPLLVLLAAVVWLELGSPVLFRQRRLGRSGRPFWLHKLRTLPLEGDGPAPRCCRLLRRCRLDELPQLVDVLRGRMALVGPRPEVPDDLVAVPAADLLRLLSCRPGLTGPTQLAFLAEDDVLAAWPERRRLYREILVPAKVQADLDWLPRRSLASDLRVLCTTPWRLWSAGARARSRRLVLELLQGQGPVCPGGLPP